MKSFLFFLVGFFVASVLWSYAWARSLATKSSSSDEPPAG